MTYSSGTGTWQNHFQDRKYTPLGVAHFISHGDKKKERGKEGFGIDWP